MIAVNSITVAATTYAKIHWNENSFNSDKLIKIVNVVIKLKKIISGSVFLDVLIRNDVIDLDITIGTRVTKITIANKEEYAKSFP